MNNIIAFLAVLSLTLPTFVSACAIMPFEEEGATVEPSGLSKAVIVWNESNRTETLILDPQFKGDAKDFGLAFAFPSRPDAQEESREIFDQLEYYTKPKVVIREQDLPSSSFGVGAVAPEASAAPEITVVEEKEVGDFSVAILQASNTAALGDWLKANGYQYTQTDEENFTYYVKKGGYFFVALKMKAPESFENQPANDRGNYVFKPISFAFQTSAPLFPSRLARHRDKEPQQKFRIYTLSNNALIVPGAATPFVRRMTQEEVSAELPSLTSYITDAQWLVKLDMKMNLSVIEDDLALVSWSSPYDFHMTTEENPRVLFADQIQKGSGIVLADAEDLRFDSSLQEKVTEFIEGPYQPESIPWYEEDWVKGLLALGILLAIHFYIGATLFSLARRLNIRHRWRAWVPAFNLSLLVNIADKRWHWFVWLIIIPGVNVLIYFLVDYYFSYDSRYYYPLLEAIIPFISILSFLVEYTLLDRIMASLTVRCGRPSWWGPLMILVPPVGLVLLGVLAWFDKQKYEIHP